MKNLDETQKSGRYFYHVTIKSLPIHYDNQKGIHPLCSIMKIKIELQIEYVIKTVMKISVGHSVEIQGIFLSHSHLTRNQMSIGSFSN